jgi:signal transduction histidine kinase
VYEFSDQPRRSIRQDLGRQRRLTEDLSGLSHAEENAYTVTRDMTDLSRLTRNVTDRLRPHFTSRNITLTATTSGLRLPVSPVPENARQ